MKEKWYELRALKLKGLFHEFFFWNSTNPNEKPQIRDQLVFQYQCIAKPVSFNSNTALSVTTLLPK